MTHEQYIEINAKGFEGDGFLKAEIQEIVKRNNIHTIVETGSFRGNTTREFSKMATVVHSIEVSKEHLDIAENTCQGIDNIIFHFGSSEAILPYILEKCSKRLFMFLDAHWNDYCPLRDELKVIKDSGLKPCIAIHDWKVPDRPLFGFDIYKGQAYELSWIEDLLIDIYGKDFKYYYNREAEGATRGVIFVNC